jgi:mycothiol synthase
VATPSDVLTAIERISRDASAADGAEPLDEGAWRRLTHHASELAVHVEDDGFTVVDGDLLHLVVAPAHRGSGLGSRLLDAALDQQPRIRQAWSHGDHPAAAALARRTGFDRVRELWVMRRTMAGLSGPPMTDELLTNPAVHVRSYRPDDEAELLRVNAAAFADHPEQGSMDHAELAERMAEPWFDAAGLLVGASPEDDHHLLGFHWTKQHSPTLGEIYVIGIDPAVQRFGVGRTLVNAGLEHLRRLGLSEVLLYVESDNERAVRLYDGVGFTHAASDTHVMYARGVSAPGS